ncbi:hypothetical protein BGI41_06495 [Methanobrevibacter sp. 87.7]|uniref:PRC-barrel domain-containing protein n=1 Tax=Methanobrevibacter sp. 87.7 TaxID=387957 RepID=UPI000B509823|nr:PRC-barrel domain-containing protein [Methanobrevibacter sp. 87.7]OWT32668.1 hypothetical protein BGI41_06495 [Methanobrevibacter sp. 87.7]
MRIKSLLGMKVLDTDAKEIGKVNDMEFDKDSGEIKKVLISLKKNFLSSNEIEVRYDDIKSIGDYLLLDVDVITE